jgi:fatty-acyl-CoA synthase
LKNVTIPQLLSETIEIMADKNAIEYEGVFYSWRELDEITNRLALI